METTYSPSSNQPLSYIKYLYNQSEPPENKYPSDSFHKSFRQESFKQLHWFHISSSEGKKVDYLKILYSDFFKKLCPNESYRNRFINELTASLSTKAWLDFKLDRSAKVLDPILRYGLGLGLMALLYKTAKIETYLWCAFGCFTIFNLIYLVTEGSKLKKAHDMANILSIYDNPAISILPSDKRKEVIKKVNESIEKLDIEESWTERIKDFLSTQFGLVFISYCTPAVIALFCFIGVHISSFYELKISEETHNELSQYLSKKGKNVD